MLALLELNQILLLVFVSPFADWLLRKISTSKAPLHIQVLRKFTYAHYLTDASGGTSICTKISSSPAVRVRCLPFSQNELTALSFLKALMRNL